jgi:hypothetical protein
MIVHGLSEFFNSKNVDWRFVYWPTHLSIPESACLYNLQKTFSYRKSSSRFKDVAWSGYNIDGTPIIAQGQVDDDSWDYYSESGIREYIDYHEIRTINKWAPCPVDKRIDQIMEWVEDCDFILLDITEYMMVPPEEKIEVAKGLLMELVNYNLKIILFDYPPIYPFFKTRYHDEWASFIDGIRNKPHVVYVAPEEIESYVQKRDNEIKKKKNPLPDILHYLSDYYHEVVEELLSGEIAELVRRN